MPKSQRAGSAPDATELLTKDHKEVKSLFRQYEGLAEAEAPAGERETLARLICQLLTVHATIEEEIFYPAVRKAMDDGDLLDEAEVEHASAKELIAQIESMKASEPLYDAKVKVLGEYIDHHVKEEEGELFPQVRRAKLDLVALGEQIGQRKAVLMAEMGIEETA